MELIEYPDREMLVMGLADRLASDLNKSLQASDFASFCVPGGTTPGPVFDVLSEVDLHWERIRVVLNDERWVPESHPRSNTRLVRERLLRRKAAAAEFVPLHADAPAPEPALAGLAAEVEKLLPLSVLLLGMGGDMHTASLFPGADRLEEALAPDAPAVMALRADAAGEPRVTLTARVLRGALATHILITGPEKRAALERARRLSPAEAPVAAVLGRAMVHWAE